MNRKIKRLLALTLAVVMVIGMPLTASAKTTKSSGSAKKSSAAKKSTDPWASFDPILYALFDEKGYADAYLDVKTQCGYDEAKLLNHYLTIGAKNGYKSNLDELINLKKYHDSYRDLQLVFGDNYKPYLIYYIAFGGIDNRSAFGTFDPISYSNRYSDVSRLYGKNVAALYAHYITVGKKEGRDGSKQIIVASSNDSGSSGSCYDEKKEEKHEERHQSRPSSSSPAPAPSVQGSTTSSGISYEQAASTDGKTIVRGRLVDENDQPIANATVTASNSNLVATGFVFCDSTNADAPGRFVVVTDADGNYSFEFHEYGSFRFTASCQGGMELDLGTIPVNERTCTTVQASPVLSAPVEGVNYVVAGKVVNTTTGEPVAGANVELRSGFGSTGAVVASGQTDAEGKYSIAVSRGYYTAKVSMQGYVAVVKNVISAAEGTAIARNNVTITNEMSTDVEYRIVLKWGENPSDLDSHFTGPDDENGRFHVYYVDKRYSEGDTQVAMLDVDDTSSYGPETITVVRLPREGKYRYSVLNYSHQTADDTQLASSGATVEVYAGSNLIRTYSVPSGVGYIWNVFDIDNGEINSVNAITGDYNSMLSGENRVNANAQLLMDESEAASTASELSADMPTTVAPTTDDATPPQEAEPPVDSQEDSTADNTAESNDTVSGNSVQ